MKEHHFLEVTRRNDVVVARLKCPRITDDLTIAQVTDELYAVAAEDDCQKLLLSFAGVVYLSSAVLGRLISLNRRMVQKGGELKLCELCPNICEIFTLTKLNTILDIRGTELAGQEAFR